MISAILRRGGAGSRWRPETSAAGQPRNRRPRVQQRLQGRIEAGAAAIQRMTCLEILRRDIIQHDDVAVVWLADGSLPRDRSVDQADAGLDMLDQENQAGDDR